MKLSLRLAALGLACLAPLALHAASSATALLQAMDKTGYSARIVARISQYAPPAKGKVQHTLTSNDAVELLLERPDRFRMVLRPGAKNELTFVAQGGITRWRDKATGVTGKALTTDAVDALALIALGTAGELQRYASLKEVDPGKNSPLRGVRLDPRVFGSDVQHATAWFGYDKPVGYGFELSDGRRIYLAIAGYQANVQTKPGDFEL
ncbi:hypothetical protein [Lysobacter silvisoli]|uniref:Outer membrane lipoprotein carrier protein LolA n=1 Tax=Lysobacter silvisoli TaxID=2293254 RepID=A0A371JZY5_9GAMM|nr:hypothetical protein [Lysobacter silvisoli]RDZ27170.1 hypothetical protein DX914_13005 [Lysobacter silvisoli]